MSNNAEDRIERLARIFGALSNPNRLRMFMRLASCCPAGTVCDGDEIECCCVGELGEEVDVAASTVSHHLKELRDAGLMKSRRCGRRIECWIDPEVLRALAEFFSAPPCECYDQRGDAP